MKPEVLRDCRRLLPRGSTVLCAVSGGADSVCLLHLLRSLEPSLGIHVRAAHYNHGLRGAEADRDEAFVRALCAGWGIALVCERGDVAGYAAKTRQGTEAAARELRYAFLQKAAGAHSLIATAHTADDNVETVLQHLLRGSALTGLAGIAPASGNLVRPLLRATRQDVLDELARHGLCHVEDSTNQTDDYLRNRLRHGVVPLLKAENPRLTDAVTALTDALRQDAALLDRLARQALETVRTGDGVLCGGLSQLDPALQGRVVLFWLREQGADGQSRHLQAVLALCRDETSPSGRISLPGGFTVRRVYDQLELVRLAGACPPPAQTVLQIPGVTRWGGFAVCCAFQPPDTGPLWGLSLALDYEALSLPLAVRGRKSGDRVPLSSGCGSVKKLFIDHKVPAHRRDAMPVITDAAGPVAVFCGTRLLGRDWRNTNRKLLWLQILPD